MDKSSIKKLTDSSDAITQQIQNGTTEFWYAREIIAALWTIVGRTLAKPFIKPPMPLPGTVAGYCGW